MKNILLLSCILVLHINESFSQTVIASSGKEISNSNVSISFTIGEPLILTMLGNDVILTNGFNQPNYLITTGIKNLPSEYDLKIYPNPVQNQLKITSTNNTKLLLFVYDVEGKLVLQTEMYEQKDLDFSFLMKGEYILQINENSQNKFNTYKILKQ